MSSKEELLGVTKTVTFKPRLSKRCVTSSRGMMWPGVGNG